MSEFKAVALGGGHGLHATLSALRLLTDHVTAVVTVADDGGSSGRIRRELHLLPPGDLRMALVALAGNEPEHAMWADLLQHRFGGEGALAGHALGNLMISAYLEKFGDAVAGLDAVGRLVGAVGRVLPMSPVPLDLVAEVDRFDGSDPDRVRRIGGQVAIATTTGRVRNVQVLPAGAPACPHAVDAVRDADLVVLGPGSWFTSVIPHLLLRELCVAIATTQAKVVVALNLVPQVGETERFAPIDLIRVMREHARAFAGPTGLRIDAIVADSMAVPDAVELQATADELGARLVMSAVAADGNPALHDPKRLSEAYQLALGASTTSRRDTVWP